MSMNRKVKSVLIACGLVMAAVGVGRAVASAGTGVEPLSFHAPAPYRVFDSRTQGNPTNLPAAKVQPNAAVTVCGPANALALAVNITATEPEASGYLVAYPANGLAGPTSAVNFVAGQTVANSAIISTNALGCIRVGTSAPTHIIVDVTGFFSV